MNFLPQNKNINKLIWNAGLPKEDGIYFLDNGLQISDKKSPLILHLIEKSSYVFGSGGSMPLNMVYDPKICKNERFACIPCNNMWFDLSIIKKEKTLAWVKHSKGYLGFGIFNPGYHNNVGGSVAWTDYPMNAFSSGFYWNKEENYKFSVVQNYFL